MITMPTHTLEAPRTVTVEVTADDIRRGLPWECGRCPVALALGRLLSPPPETRLSVGVAAIAVLRERDLSPAWQVPNPVGEWVKNFDADWDSAKPVAFTLKIPAEYLRPDVLPFAARAARPEGGAL